MAKPRRFSVRRYPNGGSEYCFEVVDGVTGAAVASGLRRADAEMEASRRSDGANGEPAGLVGLRVAIDAYVAEAGDRSLGMVARAAEALDDLREELAHADRVIAEQQTRIGQLRKLLFPGPASDLE